MTSDAKIGLLLGLVFIFIIAFLINGLPNFHNTRNNNGLTTNGFGSQNNSPGLAAKERRIQEIFNHKEVVEKWPLDESWSPSVSKQDIRSTTTLPKNISIVKTTDEVKPSKPALPKFYVVVEGDNLAVIAKKFYGDEKGNKTINVTRIFQANRKLLESPDEICVGQKLIIPPLPASAPDKSKTDGRKGKQHIVREGDSLWKIAVEQLGDGSRYTEIAKLNADILDDEDTLSIGMRLKMPAR